MSKNLLKMTGACLALSGAVAMPLQASAQESNVIVSRDAVTGKARPATLEEVAALEQVKAERVKMNRYVRKELQPRVHPTGGHGARMTDESLSASVAYIDKDGKSVQECFDSADQAKAAVMSGNLTHTHANLKPVLE